MKKIEYCPQCKDYVEVRLIRSILIPGTRNLELTFKCPRKHEFTREEPLGKE